MMKEGTIMKETVLLCNLADTDKGQAMMKILGQLGIDVKVIKKEDILHSLGYLLSMDGFEASTLEITDENIEEEMMVIHNFSDEQINLMLDIFKGADIPFIPLKAITTPMNIEWSFHQLYQEIKKEYEMMAKTKNN